MSRTIHRSERKAPVLCDSCRGLTPFFIGLSPIYLSPSGMGIETFISQPFLFYETANVQVCFTGYFCDVAY